MMIVMAIDHVRVFSGIPSGSFDPAIFFTRWVTNFCAPGFTFFAGTAIFYQARKMNDKNRLSVFLLKRGLLLILLELTVIRFFWTFNFNYSEFILAGVIWMLGCCMVIMAALSRLKPLIAGITGTVIILAQQAFQLIPRLGGFSQFIYPTGAAETGNIYVLYVIVPWIGVMALGYGFGLIMMMKEEKRNKCCLSIGLTFIALFAVIGSILVFKNDAGKNTPPFIFSLLNQNKYPPSPLFLLMTLGPLIALVPYADRAKGRLAEILTVIGRAPLFYYLIHILLIHCSAIAVNLVRDGQTHEVWYQTAPFATRQAEGVRWELPLLYFIFMIDVSFLFFACKWYVKYKKEHHDQKWLSYL